MRRGAFAVAVDATEAGDVERARGWLLIRDFRQATRFTRPGVDATTALDELGAGETSPAEAVTGVRKDLLDAYQARLLTYVDDATQASERGFAPAFAENAAIAAGYWPLLAGEFEGLRGAEAAAQTDRDFAAMAATAARGDAAGFAAARDRVLADVDGFTAAPLTPDEQVRRAQQLIRFLDLIPVEYDRGTEDGEVTLDFEIQEAVAFTEGAQSAFTDLEGILTERDPGGGRDDRGGARRARHDHDRGHRGRRCRLPGRDRGRPTRRPATPWTTPFRRSGRSRAPTPTST